MLNQLREQLTPGVSADALKLLQVGIQRRLADCREIPDLWYYRALVGDRLKDAKDAAYARRTAESLGSEALRAKFDPFTDPEGAAAAAPLPARIGGKYALVVGINEFDHAPHLNYAVNDAQSVASALTDPKTGRFQKDNVITLVNEQATLGEVRTSIGKIRERVKPDDMVLIYIASHGSPRQVDPNGVSYVIMHDTKLDTAANLYATSLQMIDLVEILRRDVQAKRVILILDTCFSGQATGSRGVTVSHAPQAGQPTDFSAATDKLVDAGARGSARVVISASRADEESHEDPKLGHGLFTYFLLDEFEKSGGTTSLESLFPNVRTRTAQAVRERFGVSQTPTIQGTSEGLKLVLGAAAAQ